MTLSARAERLLAFSRELANLRTFPDVLEAALAEVKAAVGYSHMWLLVSEDDRFERLRLIDVAGSREAKAWHSAPVLEVRGDAMLEELVDGTKPVVVVDARTDPRTNKEIVAMWHNRTLIQVPLRLLDRPLGVVGVGTFGDEGCRAPTAEELEYLVGMASQLTIAAARIRIEEERTSVAARLSEIEQRFLHAQKMEAVGRLAGGIAHDINNILLVILGNAQMAVDAIAAPHPALEPIEEIRSAADRAAGLTRQLLAFSRRQVIEPVVLDLGALVGSMEKMIRRWIGEDVALATLIEPDLPLMKADPSQLEQVIMNLVVNARDAMPRGGRLTIDVHATELPAGHAALREGQAPGRRVALRVSDTGVGMDGETLARVFEPFFTTKPHGKGTGLGLSTVYGITEQAGGSIDVVSAPGRGTTFELYFPITAERPTATRPAPAPKAQGPVTETILLVEDEAQVRRMLAALLRRHGYDVLEATRPSEALALVERHTGPIDLLVSDVVLPEQPGTELAEHLRARHPEVEVLFVSGYPEVVMAERGVVPEGMDLLLKPFMPDVLLARVRRAITRASERRRTAR
ncbi:ATP-binding protein [Myxococcota bacterium]|nr:ATP-binding protein [Myxococcota bacterium]